LCIAADRDVRIEQAEAACAGDGSIEPALGFLAGHFPHRVKARKPHQRTYGPRPRGQARSKARFQRKPCLIGDQARPVARCAADAGERALHLFRSARDSYLLRRGIEPRRACALLPSVVEKNGKDRGSCLCAAFSGTLLHMQNAEQNAEQKPLPSGFDPGE